MKSFLASLTLSLLCCASPLAAQNKDFKHKADSINRLPLKEAFLVAVDSVGEYMCEEFLTSADVHHGVLLAKTKGVDATILGRFYFDANGRLRKTVHRWLDGGDLADIVYYDANGNLVYALYNYGSDNNGMVYTNNGKACIAENCAPKDEVLGSVLSQLDMTTEEVCRNNRLELSCPSGCREVDFAELKMGDTAFLLTDTIYANPEGTKVVKANTAEDFQPYFGCVVIINSIKDGWCELGRWTFDAPIGYVRADCLEKIFSDIIR